MSRANFREPVTFVRSPIMRKLLSGRSVSGRVPLSRRYGATVVLRCGLTRRTASAIARMWSGVGAAAAADDVHPAALGELAQHAGHVGRAEVVLAHFVRQAGVRMATDPRAARLPAAASRCGRISSGPERTVHADREHREVGDRIPKRFDVLAGDKRRPALVERAGDHHRARGRRCSSK